MNLKRILMGGLLAGVFINVSEGILNAGILMDEYEAAMTRYGLAEPDWALAGYLFGGFVFGLTVAWLYAAIRPRFGPGWRTGAVAGAALWVVGYAVPTLWFAGVGLTFGTGPTTLALIWGLAEMAVAGVIAGWVYRESAAPA